MKKTFLTLDFDGYDLDRKNTFGLSSPFPLPPYWEIFRKTTTLGDTLEMLYPSDASGLSLMNQLEAKVA